MERKEGRVDRREGEGEKGGRKGMEHGGRGGRSRVKGVS